MYTTYIWCSKKKWRRLDFVCTCAVYIENGSVCAVWVIFFYLQIYTYASIGKAFSYWHCCYYYEHYHHYYYCWVVVVIVVALLVDVMHVCVLLRKSFVINHWSFLCICHAWSYNIQYFLTYVEYVHNVYLYKVKKREIRVAILFS